MELEISANFFSFFQCLLISQGTEVTCRSSVLRTVYKQYRYESTEMKISGNFLPFFPWLSSSLVTGAARWSGGVVVHRYHTVRIDNSVHGVLSRKIDFVSFILEISFITFSGNFSHKIFWNLSCETLLFLFSINLKIYKNILKCIRMYKSV